MAASGGMLSDLAAKTVVYLPKGGSSRSIYAVVTYLGPKPMDGLRGGSRPQFDLSVRNSSVYGISSRELNTGGDKVQIPLRLGRSVKTVRLVELIAQDRAMLRIRAW